MNTLKNNSREMKTVVETFIIEETAELIYDNEKLDKWNELVSELGLYGQTKIVAPEKSPIPFMHLKTSLVNVFECLCPRKVDVEEYCITPIPVEILDLIALSKKENYFSKLQIWYDDKSPDPVCIGMNYSLWYSHKDDGGLNKSFSTYNDALKNQEENGWFKRKPYGTSPTYYLLGKWADVKHSFEELKEIAKNRYISEKANELKKQIKEAQRQLDDIETEAFDKFN